MLRIHLLNLMLAAAPTPDAPISTHLSEGAIVSLAWAAVAALGIVGVLVLAFVKAPHFSTEQWVKIPALVGTLAGSIMGIGDKITAIPGLPGGFVHYWPLVMAISIAVHQASSVFVAPPKPTPAGDAPGKSPLAN